jgi:hypothetical protein
MTTTKQSIQCGRGLSPLPIVIATHCLHGVAVADDCKQCERDLRPRRRTVRVGFENWPAE